MLTKFETKSNRVKGLAFHPQRPWVLSSLHNGAIQLWDYRMGTLIDRYDEHEGPVRSVDFHPTQPLFVSGGDDYKIKVWNYKLRRCIFTLMGHLDYIRTVSFHPESPWIVSASDDQTVRIWNWQNRSCLAVLSGHNHYVMSASFHPAEDLVVSASLDQTVRVWDISALRQKAVRPSDMMSSVRGQLPASVNADLFGSMDAAVRHVLEGHTRGVNWAAFHPTLPLIVSAGDDRHVKLWRMSDTKAWEMDTLRGHLNNVSCALFHPRADLVMTASEDKTIRVWDLNRRSCIQTFRREADRFWILATHPTVNLMAAGHDNGMLVFKLQRERPAYTTTDAALMYVKDRYLRVLDFNNGRDSPLATVRQAAASMFDSSPFLGGGFGGGSSGSSTGATLQPPPRSMSFNSVERAVLLNYDADGGSYELFTNLSKDGVSSSGSGSEPVADMRRGRGVSAVFVGRNRFAVLDKTSGIVSVRDLRNVETKQVPSPLPGADALFAAGNGFVLVRSEEQVALLDLQQRKVVAELAATHVKYVVWSDGMKRVALLGKHVILIASRRLELLATVHETIRVKSAAWDDSGVLLYSTLNHVKYCLPNGDSGTVATLPHPLYLTRVRGPALCYLDREGAPGILAIDPTEYAFKLLLLRKRYDDVKRMIADNRLRGQAIIAYLQAKGFPDVALHFVRDEPTRFALALASGSIDVALTAAQALDEPGAWRQLASEALRQGNVEVVELCYQRAKDLDRLAFLYVITGNFDKLTKMAKIAAARGQVAARFQIANYLGDVTSRVGLLRDCGQPALARLTASAHGLMEELTEELPPAVAGEDGQPGDDSSAIATRTEKSSLLLPPVPLSDELNWPLLSVSRGLFQRDPNASGAFEEPPVGDYYEDAAAFEASERDGGDEDGLTNATISAAPAAPVVDPFAAGLDAPSPTLDAGDGGWGDDLDMDLPGDEGLGGGNGDAFGGADDDEFGTGTVGGGGGGGQYYVPPTVGAPASVRWTRGAKVAGELAAAGAFEEALGLLRRQIGLVDSAPLRDPLRAAYTASRGALPSGSGLPAATIFFSRTEELPAVVAGSLLSLRERLQAAQAMVTQGRFREAHQAMEGILAAVPLLVVTSPPEEAEAGKILSSAREYVIGMQLQMAQSTAKRSGDVARCSQAAALFTFCGLAPGHVQLALKAAMKVAYGDKNFVLASSCARRLLETSPKPEVAGMARKMIQFCDRNPTNAVEVDCDERRTFVIDAGGLVPLYAGEPRTVCGYCAAVYAPASAPRTCKVCGMGGVGVAGTGLKVLSPSCAV